MTHGKYWSYTGGGCRCAECRAAHAAYQRRYRQIRKQTGWRLLHGRWVKT